MIDEIALLRESDGVPQLDEGRLAAIRAALDAAIAEERFAAAPRLPHRRRPWLVGAAVAAAAAAIALPIATSAGPAHRGAAQIRGTILARLADVAIAQPPTVPPGPGQYQYSGSVEADQSCNLGAGGYCALVPEHRQIWIGSDSSGRLRETFGAPEFLTPADKAAWEAAGSPSLGNGTSDTSFGPNALSDGPSSLANAPTDPTALKAAIEDRSLEGGHRVPPRTSPKSATCSARRTRRRHCAARCSRLRPSSLASSSSAASPTMTVARVSGWRWTQMASATSSSSIRQPAPSWGNRASLWSTARMGTRA